MRVLNNLLRMTRKFLPVISVEKYEILPNKRIKTKHHVDREEIWDPDSGLKQADKENIFLLLNLPT